MRVQGLVRYIRVCSRNGHFCTLSRNLPSGYAAYAFQRRLGDAYGLRRTVVVARNVTNPFRNCSLLTKIAESWLPWSQRVSLGAFAFLYSARPSRIGDRQIVVTCHCVFVNARFRRLAVAFAEPASSSVLTSTR